MEELSSDAVSGEFIGVLDRLDHRLTDDDIFLVLASEPLEAGGDIDGITDDRCIHATLGPDRPDDDLAHIDPDPDIELLSDGGYLEPLDKVLDLDGTREGIIRVLLLEDDHDTVPEEFIDVSAVFVDNLPDTVEVDIEEE